MDEAVRESWSRDVVGDGEEDEVARRGRRTKRSGAVMMVCFAWLVAAWPAIRLLVPHRSYHERLRSHAGKLEVDGKRSLKTCSPFSPSQQRWEYHVQ